MGLALRQRIRGVLTRVQGHSNMSESFSVKFDFSQLEKEIRNLAKLEEKINTSIGNLAKAAYLQAIALAKQKLHSTQNLYLENLKFETTTSGQYASYLIILNEPAVWIDDGHGEIDMRKTHLKGRDKLIIPFTHKKEGMQKSTMSPTQQGLYQEIKNSLKQNKMSLSKPINDPFGKPVLSSPGKPRAAAMIAKVASQKKGSMSGESVLNRLHIYQSEQKKTGKVSKTFMTFRTLSEDSKAEWIIPAYKAQKILDETYNWILTNYNKFLEEGLANLKITT